MSWLGSIIGCGNGNDYNTFMMMAILMVIMLLLKIW